MRDLTRSALVSRSPETLYRLVEDVERYPEFVPGCTEAKVLERGDHEMLARLAVRRGPLHAAFTTRNHLDPGRGVQMHLVEGPFRVLEGRWSFIPIADKGCRIELRLRFQFATALKSALFDPFFEDTAASLVRAFVTRAQSLPAEPLRLRDTGSAMEAMSKRCSVVCDTPQGLRECEVVLPEGATVGEALAAARQRLAELLIDWEVATVGIYGQLCSRDHVPADADRIEIYRALPADPRVARRARVARDAAGLRKARGT